MAQICERLCGDETESLHLTWMLKTEVEKALKNRKNGYLKKYEMWETFYQRNPWKCGQSGITVLKQPKISEDLPI